MEKTNKRSQLKTPPLKQLNQKFRGQENLPDFSWYEDCLDFLKKNKAYGIDDIDHPRIYVIDKYLKMVMDGLLSHNREFLKEAVNGSPMRLIRDALMERM